MKTKKYGVVGYKGKIGSLLVQRTDFVPIDVDITKPDKNWGKLFQEVDLLINCAGMSSIDLCETQYQKAVDLNVSGLRNLHHYFGERVLNLGSEQIYTSRWVTPSETTTPGTPPDNSYGLTKYAAEAISNAFGGKTIRLSRSVSIADPDIANVLYNLYHGRKVWAPIYLLRSYLHRMQVADGIEYFARNFDLMPHIVNYGASRRTSFYALMRNLSKQLGFNPSLVRMKVFQDKTKTPRPLLSGLNVTKAKELGFPIYDISDTVSVLAHEHA